MYVDYCWYQVLVSSYEMHQIIFEKGSILYYPNCAECKIHLIRLAEKCIFPRSDRGHDIKTKPQTTLSFLARHDSIITSVSTTPSHS